MLAIPAKLRHLRQFPSLQWLPFKGSTHQGSRRVCGTFDGSTHMYS